MKFETGQIVDENDVCGFYVLPLAIAARDSAWDFPSFVMWLGLDHLFTDSEPTMYPTRDDARIIADAIDLEPDCYDDFINNFPLTWDT